MIQQSTIRTFRSNQVPRPKIDETLFSQFIEKSHHLGHNLDLEIGCGVGWHPISYAKQNPQRSLIAIEHTAEKFKSFKGRFLKHPKLIENLLPIHANAISVITHLIPEKSLDRIFLFYPNPEPKNKSARWIRQPFFERLIQSLKDEGSILIVTNEYFYFKEVLEFAKSAWQLELKSTIYNQENPLPQARTHFEKKYWERGQTLYEVQLFPVDPKPPAPRSVSESSLTS